MELIEYLTVRKAYNLVRHEADARERLTFPEFAILCRLSNAGGSLKTSEIADYQGSLRPTMTHRTKHLSMLGFISRAKGQADRRNVVCELTDDGARCVEDLCAACCAMIKSGQPLSRVDAERMSRYIDAMGAVTAKAGDLVMLGILTSEEGSASVTDLVELLGLLQPTVSMSVSSLVEEGLVTRAVSQSGVRSSAIMLTEEGSAQAQDLAERIDELVVRRKQRGVR